MTMLFIKLLAELSLNPHRNIRDIQCCYKYSPHQNAD